MSPDPFSAVWVSHSSISDFIKCPRAYYLKNVYKDPETRHKITIMTPSLALGQIVHEVVESLSIIPTEQRFAENLINRFNQLWKKVAGQQGGFSTPEQEEQYRQRGESMIRRIIQHPGPLKNLAVKIKAEGDLPRYWLSEAENIILCGKIDWLEYLPETDRVNILDFKTGKYEEDANSLQLPIYHLLVSNTQKRSVNQAFYWYLDHDDHPIEKQLPDLLAAETSVLDVAKKIKVARKLNVFKCPKSTGCFACKPFEAILRGEGRLMGTNEYRVDVYVLGSPTTNDEDSSVIL